MTAVPDILKTSKKEYLAYMREKISTEDAWAHKALMLIYSFQTPLERSIQMAAGHNGKGFNRLDAKPLSYIAKKVMAGMTLNKNDYVILKDRMPKYVNQIYPVALERAKEKEKALKETGKIPVEYFNFRFNLLR